MCDSLLRPKKALLLLAAPLLLGAGGARAAGWGLRSAGEEIDKELGPKAVEAAKGGKLGELRADLEERIKKLLAGAGALKSRLAELDALERHRRAAQVLDFPADEETAKFVTWLLGRKEFCSRFCHALEVLHSPAECVKILRRLKKVEGVKEADYLKYAEMNIAFALAWSNYRWMYWANIPAGGDRAEEIYKYYVTYRPLMRLPLERLPHELLRYVIDHPLSEAERKFALEKYRAARAFGPVFFEIVWTTQGESMKQGKNKKLPYTLMNIKKNGGVCMEQAYYSSCVAKCLGVPATYTCGDGKRGGHAWIGFLDVSQRPVRWNFNSGRYSYDHYWKGEVYDPACRWRRLSDGEVGMTAGMLYLPKSALESADSRRNLAAFVWTGFKPAWKPAAADAKGRRHPWGPVWRGKPPRFRPEPGELDGAKKAMLFELLHSSVQLNPFSRRTWDLVGQAAEKGTFTLDQLQKFSDHLFRKVGEVCPDYVCFTVQRFMEAVQKDEDRDRLYETCFNYFRKRPDLAAELKVAQGRMWEKKGKGAEALAAYVAAVATFPRDGHVTKEAANCLDNLLAKEDPKKAAEILKKLWVRMSGTRGKVKPEEQESLRLIGENLLKYLKKADMKEDLEKFEPVFKKMFPTRRKK